MIVHRIIQDYYYTLNAGARFPKAGVRNTKVEELTDLCITSA
jgi:hypothetical protein